MTERDAQNGTRTPAKGASPTTGWQIEDLGSSGHPERTCPILDEGIAIGRGGTGLCCPDDAQMADCQARLRLQDGAVVLEDAGQGSGVWLRLTGSEGRRLRSEDQLWVGAQLLLLRAVGEKWELRHHGPDGRLREVHALPETGVFIGRASDLVLDPNDPQLSRRHAQLIVEGGHVRAFDRGAHNGTYLKITRPETLEPGDEFRISTHRFRLQVATPVEGASGATSSAPVPEPASVPEAASASAPAPASDRGLDPEVAPEPRPQVPSPDEPAGPVSPEAEATVLAVRPEPEAAAGTPTARTQRKSGLASRLRRMGSRANETQTAEVERAQDEQPTTTDAGPEMLGETLPLGPAEVSSATPSRSPGGEPASAASERVEIVLEWDQESVTLEARVGQTVLDAVQEAGLARGEPLDWECGDGGCGVCVMGIVDGADQLDPPDPAQAEMKTIQITEQVAPDPTRYRLTCLARVRGRVRLRRL